MSSSRFSFVILSVVLYLSIQQTESSAFSWTKNLYRKIRKNQSRLQPASITLSNLNRMWERPDLNAIRIGASRSSRSCSVSAGDGEPGDYKQQSPTHSSWWRKDPRNRSVSGILICTFETLHITSFNYSILSSGALQLNRT